MNNIGIEIGKEWFLKKDSSEEQRNKIEHEIKQTLNNGGLGILNFLEVQLISGYDENGFVFLTPWGGQAESEQKKLTFSTWRECFDRENFAGFILLNKRKTSKDFPAMLKESLSLGLEYLKTPEKHQNSPKYRIGYGAWDNWSEGIKKGLNESHGSWWNGMVWVECRKMGSDFFKDAADVLTDDKMQDVCMELSSIYKKQGAHLDLIKEKDIDPVKKIDLIEECKKLDHFAEEQMEKLQGML